MLRETIECVPIANPVTAGFPGCRVTRYTREGKVFKYAVLAPNTREAVRWLTGWMKRRINCIRRDDC